MSPNCMGIAAMRYIIRLRTSSASVDAVDLSDYVVAALTQGQGRKPHSASPPRPSSRFQKATSSLIAMAELAGHKSLEPARPLGQMPSHGSTGQSCRADARMV